MICATVDQPGAFADQASLKLLELYPELGAGLTHFPSTHALWRALNEGLTNVIVVAEQTTPFDWDDLRRHLAAPTSDLYVQAAANVPYRCALLAAPGSRIGNLTTICGDAALWLCADWLGANLPTSRRVIVGTSLTEAARDILYGDGTMALVATAVIGTRLGLVTLASDIDDGATSKWLAISKSPMFAQEPGRLLIAARFGDTGELGDLVAALWEFGFRLTVASAHGTSRGPTEQDYLLAFAGGGRLVDVIGELHRYIHVRLLGAYEERL